jgi:hypothetical protein
MLENKEKRAFKFETARVSNVRLVSARTDLRKDRRTRLDETRAIVVKLIEAIRKM